MMTSAQVVETSVDVTTNSPSEDYTHPDDHNLLTYDTTPGFKPFPCNLCFQDIVIQQDDEIRLRIVGTRVDANDIVSAVFYYPTVL